MNPIRALLVEDEFFAAEMLRSKLEAQHPDVEIIALCTDAEEALVEILHKRPDLLFLDIQLPQKNGIWLAFELHRLTSDTFTPPALIFTSAYNDSSYLTDAFRVAAIDYLIKPFPPEDLARAIDRFRQRQGRSNLSDLVGAVEQVRMIPFRDYHGLALLKPDAIAYIEADGHYVKVVQDNGKAFSAFESISEVEQKLPAAVFFRAGRSLILNRMYIRNINAHQSTVRLVTASVSFDLSLPGNALRGLRKGFE